MLKSGKIKYSILSLFLTLLILQCQSSGAILTPSTVPATETSGGDTYITILHTNDHHGRFWKNSKDEYGMAARKTLIDSIRSEVSAAGGYVLLLSGGDINTGVPESDTQDAEPDFKGMTLLGYDAMALGNHEFDNPISLLRTQKTWAEFPFLSANTIDKKTGRPLFEAYRIFKVGTKKVAVVGFTTEDTVRIGNPEFLDDVIFESPSKVAAQLIPQLRKKADYVFAVTHMGHYADAQHGSNAPGDVTLARSVDGINLIVGGHTQEPLFEPDVQNGTYILQAFEWGKYVGRMDLILKEDGSMELVSYKLIPVNLKNKDGSLMGAELEENSEMLGFLQPYQDRGAELLGIVIGKLDGKLNGDRAVVRYQETNMGNFIARSMVNSTGADFGIMNSGGIRDSLEAGEVSYRDILTVQPFGNSLATVELSSAEVEAYLLAVVAKTPGSGAFAQFANVSFTYSNGAISELKIKGEDIDSSKTYKMVVNNYVAVGGDGYPKLSEHPSYIDTGYVDADSLVNFIKTLDGGQIRIADYDTTDAVVRK